MAPPQHPNFAVVSQMRSPGDGAEFVAALRKQIEADGAKVISLGTAKIGGREGTQIVYSVGADIWSRLIIVQHGRRRVVVAQHRTPKAGYLKLEPALASVLATIHVAREEPPKVGP